MRSSPAARSLCNPLLIGALSWPLLVLSLACDGPSRGDPNSADRPPTAATRRAVPPSVNAKITQVAANWKDNQQTFDLALANTGDRTETIHAIVYARNETINPPRRAISPPTAY